MFFAILLMTDGLQGHFKWINSLWILSSEAITLIFILTIGNCRTYYATPPVPHFVSSTSSLFPQESKMTLSGGLVLIFNSVKRGCNERQQLTLPCYLFQLSRHWKACQQPSAQGSECLPANAKLNSNRVIHPNRFVPGEVDSPDSLLR